MRACLEDGGVYEALAGSINTTVRENVADC